MFNLSGSELIFLVIIALVVLGPDKLPEAMRKAGKMYGDFKKMTTGFQSEMRSVLDEPMRELRETAELAKRSAMFDINATPAEKPVSATMAAQTPPHVDSPAGNGAIGNGATGNGVTGNG
ncbi:MAG: twin-arginine translocase TatA/TatE family subunit, partial [Ilumatobacteraceae bacterium]